MAVIVPVLGGLSAVIGLMGVLNPRSMMALAQRHRGPVSFWFAVSFRLVLGAVFLAVAPDCHAPMVVRVTGVVSIAAALGLVVLGTARLDKFIEWWLGRSLTYVRLWASGAIAFGALLIYAGP